MLSIALKGMIRNYRTPLVMTFALILSVGLLLGTSYTTKIIVANVIDSKVKEVPVDYVFGVNTKFLNETPDLKEVRDTVLSVEHVSDVKVVWKRPVNCFVLKSNVPINMSIMLNTINNGTAKNSTIAVFGVLPVFINSSEDIVWIRGNKTESINEVAIPKDFALEENLDIGDTLYLMQYKRYLHEVIYVNVTVTGIYEFKGNLKKIFLEKERLSNIFLTSPSTLIELINKKMTGSGYAYSIDKPYYAPIEFDFIWQSLGVTTEDLYVYVFFKRNEIINTWDAQQTENAITRLSKTIFNRLKDVLDIKVTEPNTLFSASPLKAVFENLYFWTMSSRLFYAIMYIFLVVLMIEFVKAISYLYKSRRLRDIGLLLLRGASQNQLKRIFLYESLLIGSVSLIGSLLVGYIISWYFTQELAPVFNINIIYFSFLLPSYSDILVSIILIALFLYIMLHTLTTDISTVTPVSIIQIAEEKKSELKTRRDKVKFYILLGGLIASSLKLISLYLGTDISWLWGINVAGMFFIVWMLLFIVAVIDSFLLIFGNITFIYCAIKLISLKIDKISKILAKAIRRILGDLSLVTAPHLSKTVVRYARVGLVIGLVVSMGTSVSIARASIIYFNGRVAKVSIGADINLVVHTNDLNKFENLTTTAGVLNTTYIFTSVPKKFIFTSFIDTYVVAINPDKYLSVAKDYIDDDFTQHGMFKALRDMAKNKTFVLINKKVATDADVNIGDDVNLWYSINNTAHKLNCTVLDIINALPGYPELSKKPFSYETITIADYEQKPFVVINQGLLNKSELLAIAGPETTILIDTDNEHNQTQIADEITEKYDYQILSVTTAEEKLNEANLDLTILSDVEYLWLEYLIMLLISTLAVIISMISIAENRKRELGMMIARGADTNQLIKILISEFLAILLIVIPMSVIVGIPATYSILPQLSAMKRQTTIPIPLIISYDFFVVAVLSALSVIAGILASVYKIKKEKVADVIQFE